MQGPRAVLDPQAEDRAGAWVTGQASLSWPQNAAIAVPQRGADSGRAGW